MRIAVTTGNGQIFQHFGYIERFKGCGIEDGRVKIAAVVNANGSGRGAQSLSSSKYSQSSSRLTKRAITPNQS